ncbi:hypothetical protein J5N97_009641 [Dioscorea zingiberensis]|uniref:Uncharacterized protein n=1 Tax=Dioscorea zingiberensis TaxID=325984 RepID=A0A9D5CXJ5_9LILI|nr:hypothetical protein J5N97_009641 [Dioscorea zingiberensis]
MEAAKEIPVIGGRRRKSPSISFNQKAKEIGGQHVKPLSFLPLPRRLFLPSASAIWDALTGRDPAPSGRETFLGLCWSLSELLNWMHDKWHIFGRGACLYTILIGLKKG